jgi:hypothetical protein
VEVAVIVTLDIGCIIKVGFSVRNNNERRNGSSFFNSDGLGEFFVINRFNAYVIAS